MRFEKYSEKIVNQATTKLLLGKPITDNERLNVIRYLATAAKANGDIRNWHHMLNIIDSYENIVSMPEIDRILIKLIPKLGFFEEKTD